MWAKRLAVPTFFVSAVKTLNSHNQPLTKICRKCGKQYSGADAVCPDDGMKLTKRQPDSLIGTIFAGKYEIQAQLGQGGMSIVYKARHRFINRPEAIKLLLETQGDDPNAFQRFQQEAELASTLSHQNIVSIHDFGFTDSGQPYFVMDCLEGQSLEDIILREGRVSVPRAIDIFRQICDGLEHAHKRGIIHRDLKPSNIVLIKEEDGSETAKIVDFGVAKAHQQTDRMRLTQTGQVMGSPVYMSPEQCQDFPLDQRSDIYSLGCLMYETLTGSPPFSAGSFFDLACLHVAQKPPPFAQKAPEAEIPAALESVVAKCLEKKSDDRFQSVEQVRQKLLDAALLSGVSGLKPGAVPAPKNHQRSAPVANMAEHEGCARSGPWQSSVIGRMSLLWSVGLVLAALTTVAAFVFLWQGPEGDRGTPFDKTYWACEIALAQHAVKAGIITGPATCLTTPWFWHGTSVTRRPG